MNNFTCKNPTLQWKFPSEPVIAGIFVVALGWNLQPMLSSYMKNWKRYVMTLLPKLKHVIEFVSREYFVHLNART